MKRAHFYGNLGKSGHGQECDGPDGKDVRFKVPIGTEVYRVFKSDPNSNIRNTNIEHLELVVDLDE